MTEETSEAVASVAGRVLRMEPVQTERTVDAFNALLKDAKTLAGSALTQHESDRCSTCGEPRGECEHPDKVQDEPEGNALAPEVMRAEMINIVVGQGEGRIHRHAAGNIVDAILQKQMQYYAAMATPEVSVPVEDQMRLVLENSGLVSALITQGAAFTQFMAPDKLVAWRNVAERARDNCKALLEMFS